MTDINSLSLEELYKLKSEYENLATANKNLQLAKKVTLNSAYGTLGTKYFPFFDVDIAEAITLSGQYVIQFLDKRINEFLNNKLGTENFDYVVMGDTDSVYLNLEKYVETLPEGLHIKEIVAAIDKFSNEEIQPVISNTIREISEYTKAYKPFLKMKREVICERGIYPKGKKRYALLVWADEGKTFSEPKIKITGLDMIKSKTPEWCKSRLKHALKLILTSDEASITAYVKQVREDFKKLSLKEVSIPSAINTLDEYKIDDKGIPIANRAALLYNKFISDNNLQTTYVYARKVDRIKYSYILEPNIFRSNIIGFVDIVPKDFPVQVDYKTQFEKVFLSPLQNLLEAIDWKLDRPKKLNFKKK